jgi:hypothetical protein
MITLYSKRRSASYSSRSCSLFALGETNQTLINKQPTIRLAAQESMYATMSEAQLKQTFSDDEKLAIHRVHCILATIQRDIPDACHPP